MAKVVGAVIVLFILSTGMELEISNPEEVEVTSARGQFNAEILSVRDSSLVLASPCGLSQDDLINKKAQILVVREDEIYGVKTAGSSNIFPGMLFGGTAGCVSGCLIGRSLKVTPTTEPYGCNKSEDELRNENGVNYAVGVGAGGILLGAIIGAATSSRDSLWITPVRRDFRALKPLARYPLQEPQFLNEIR